MNTSAAMRRWGGRLAGLAVSLIAIVIVVSTVDLGATVDVLSRTEPAYIVLALAVIPLQVMLRGWRWRMLLPPRPDGTTVPVRRTISPMLVGYLGNNVLPARLGEAIRAFLVARRESLVPLVAFGATMLERLIDVVALALIGLAAALLLGAAWWIIAIGLAAGVGGVLVLALLVTLGFSRLVDVGRWMLERVHLADRLERLLDWAGAFAAGVDRGRNVPRLLGAMGLSFLAWVVDASIFYFVGLALGIELGLAQAALIGAVAVLATAVPAAPGYVGTFELAATSTAVALGVPREEALAMAVLVHMVTLIPVAIAGAIVLITSGASLGTIATEAEAAEDVHRPSERAPLPVG